MKHILLLMTCFGFLLNPALAEWEVHGLSEQEHVQWVESLFVDQLYYSTEQAASSYLKHFKKGSAHERMLFLYARTHELQQLETKETLARYYRFRKKYPQSQWKETALFATGYLQFQSGEYAKATWVLRQWLKEFPESSSVAMAQYWFGMSAFYHADTQPPKTKAKKKAKHSKNALYQEALDALSSEEMVSQLSPTQQRQRLFILGRLWVHSKQYKKARQAFADIEKDTLPQDSWYASLHYEIASLYEQQKRWEPAIQHYQRVSQVEASEGAQKLKAASNDRVHSLQDFLAQKEFNRFIDKKSWKSASKSLRKNLERGHLVANDKVFETLVWIETQRQYWKGILSAYALWDAHHQKKGKRAQAKNPTKKPAALITQAVAASQLKQHKKATTLYEQALNNKPSAKERLNIAESLGALYQQKQQHKKLIKLYEQTYPTLKDKAKKRHFAFVIGYHYLVTLKEPKSGSPWLKKADQGGVHEEEVQALLLLVEAAKAQKDSKTQLSTLQSLAKRPLPAKSSWRIEVHYQLARLHQEQEQWEQAKAHYQSLIEVGVVKGYEAHHKEAQQQVRHIGDYLQHLTATSQR